MIWMCGTTLSCENYRCCQRLCDRNHVYIQHMRVSLEKFIRSCAPRAMLYIGIELKNRTKEKKLTEQTNPTNLLSRTQRTRRLKRRRSQSLPNGDVQQMKIVRELRRHTHSCGGGHNAGDGAAVSCIRGHVLSAYRSFV